MSKRQTKSVHIVYMSLKTREKTFLGVLAFLPLASDNGYVVDKSPGAYVMAAIAMGCMRSAMRKEGSIEDGATY